MWTPRLHVFSQNNEHEVRFSAIEVNSFCGHTVFAATSKIALNFDPINNSLPMIMLINFIPQNEMSLKIITEKQAKGNKIV